MPDRRDTATAKPSHPREASAVKHWHREADVVIVGAGGAGVCAALEARAAGADVIVLERAWKGGLPVALRSDPAE